MFALDLDFQREGSLLAFLLSIIIWAGFSKDFSKVKTILANEVIIDGPICPAINIWLARLGQIMIPCTARDH